MKLTYTIEVDMAHRGGPNVTPDRVSAAVINDLIRYFSDYTVTVPTTGKSEDAELVSRDAVVWPHEDSVPHRMAMQPRETVDRVPETRPADDAIGDPV